MASKKTSKKKAKKVVVAPPPKKLLVGRPTKYLPEFCQQLVDYFQVEYEEYTEQVASQGRAVTIKKQRLKKFPTIEGFCSEIMISKDTFHEWVKLHREFSDAYKLAKQSQKDSLIKGGLSGQFNGGFAKFVAINCTDMIDKTEVKTEGDVTVKPYGLAFDLKKKPEDL